MPSWLTRPGEQRKPFWHFCLPATFERDHPHPIRLPACLPQWQQDPREEGEPLWHERFPKSVLNDLSSNMGSYAAAGQLQQRPVPRGGGMFKLHWFADRFLNAAPPIEAKVRRWDLAVPPTSRW